MAENNNLEAIRQAIENTPLLSPNAARLLEATAVPEHELASVVAIVKHDSVLTARLLRIVNSPVFGLMNTVTSIDRAIAYLGERLVVGVAIADSAGKLFSKEMEGYAGEKGDLWRHDLFCAFAARQTALHARQELDAEMAFTGGLLHDIGKGIISDFLKGSPEAVVDEIEKGGVEDYLAAERERIGMDHAMAGYELARHWQLPRPLRQTIRYHHQPSLADDEWRPLVYAVHLGDIIAMMDGCGTGSDSMQYHLDQGYETYLDISQETLAMAILTAQDEFSRAEAAFASAKEGG